MSGFDCPACGHHIRRTMEVLPGMTRMQKQALDVVVDYYVRTQRPPTYSEIATALDLKSKSGVSRLLDGLIERHYVTRMAKRRQTLALTPAAWALYEHAA